MTQPVARRSLALQNVFAPINRFFVDSDYARRQNEPGIFDFAIGNPQDMALPEFVEALQRWTTPRSTDWFGYPFSRPEARAAVAAALRQWRGVAFEPDDIFLTNGAFAALAVALSALTDVGDEVIFNSPPWFFYETMITSFGAVPVRVKVRADSFDLDVEAIAAAITPRTRAIIVNSPHNPTGRIYTADNLRALGEVLSAASARHGRTIYLFSDEAYSRIVFDGRGYVSPTDYYPASLMLYTYGKVLLTPGERLGYIALPPRMPERQALRTALFLAQLVNGYAFPNALLQHALGDLEAVSIDIPRLQRKRDGMASALRQMGYELHVPEGTFYMLPRSPLADDWAFTKILAQHDIFVLPGAVVELPGYFRLSLTANEQIIEGALPGFAAALAEARGTA